MTNTAGTLIIVKATPTVTIPPVSITYGTTPTKLTFSIGYAGAAAPSGAVTIKVDSGSSLDGHVYRLVVAAVVQRRIVRPRH